MEWDVFIAHASEDKIFASKLAKELSHRGLRVWLDALILRVGDSLLRSIDDGLRHSKYGIVILSPHFFAKEWPQKELDALLIREDGGDKVILPIWHNINYEQIQKYSLILASKFAVKSNDSLKHVVAELLRAM
jgi:hypothetical protein